MMFPRLADLRCGHDPHQEDVAKYLCIHREVYGRYERGTREIPAWAVIKLADLYHTSTGCILDRTNRRDPIKQPCGS